jgi:hypothetical protein
MPRKKDTTTASNSTQDNTNADAATRAGDAKTNSTVAVSETIDREMIDGRPAVHDAPSTTETPKNWGPPYKAIYTNAVKGFELGEDRRWKQRVFKFSDKPGPDVIDALKAAGFKYRAEEKSWTVQATPVTRELSDQLAQQFAGEEIGTGRGR